MTANASFLDDYRAPGKTPSFFQKDSQIGDTVTGAIVDLIQTQVTDYITSEPKTWDNGDPQMQVVITLQTDERFPGDEDDDGRRSIYIKTWGKQWYALWEAAKATGAKKLSEALQIGGTFTATFVATEEPKKRGMSPTKIYQYQIAKPQPGGLDQYTTPASQAQPVQAPAGGQAGDPWATQQQAPQQAPQVPAYGQDTTSGPVHANTTSRPDIATKARQLISLGLPDDQVAQATGLDTSVIQTLRAAL